MRPLVGGLAAFACLLAAGCAAVPGQNLGTVPPRSPVGPREGRELGPLDVFDPMEGFNRGVYRFDAQFDRWIFLPVVGAYERVTPRPVRRSVSNFFNNLLELRYGWNGALQGRGDVVGTALGRLMINSTLGVFGLFDPATAFGYRVRKEDLGLTFGRWGSPPGPYLVLPLLGPSNLRDAAGTAGDMVLTNLLPGVEQINRSVFFNPAVYVLYAVDQRYQIPFRYYRSGSPFEYDIVRLLYTRLREHEIRR